MRIRTILIITGAAVAVLTAGAFAFVKAGAPAGAARAAQGLPQADPPRDGPPTPSSGSSAAPSASPSKTPENPTPTPTHDDEPDAVAARIAPPEPEKTERPNSGGSDNPESSGGSENSGGSDGSETKALESGSCEASYYWQGQMTASGESFDPSELTAAHKTLPFGSKVRVTNKNNGESVVVRINDRGPFTSGRCLDLSKAAMEDVGGTSSGVVPVRYEVLSRG